MSEEGEGEGAAPEDGGKSRGKRLKGIAAKVVQFGGAFRKRHTVFADTLTLLRDMELIDDEQRERLEGLWQAGDEAAKAAVEALVGKVANLEFDQIDVGSLKQAGMAKAAEVLAPTVEKLRATDLENFLLRYPDPMFVDAVLDRTTAVVKGTQRLLGWGAVVLLLVAGVILLPKLTGVAAHAEIYYYGVQPALFALVALLCLLGVWQIRRTLRSLDLDLATLNRLHPHERRAIVISRIARKTKHVEKVQQGLDWLSENLKNTEPERKRSR